MTLLEAVTLTPAEAAGRLVELLTAGQAMTTELADEIDNLLVPIEAAVAPHRTWSDDNGIF